MKGQMDGLGMDTEFLCMLKEGSRQTSEGANRLTQFCYWWAPAN